MNKMGSFAALRLGEDKRARTGGRGKHSSSVLGLVLGLDLPSKKSSLQNIFGSNLSLQNKKVSGTAKTPYAELRSALENFSKTDPVLLLAQVYHLARTYFSRHPE